MSLVAFLLAAALASLATAEERRGPTIQLVYQRGAGTEMCPDQTQIERRVAERLGYSPFSSSGERVVRVQLERSADSSLVAQLSVRSIAGEFQGRRSIPGTSEDCASLAVAVEVALGYLIDPRSLDATPIPAHPDAVRHPVASVVPVELPTPAREARWQLVAGALANAGVSSSPGGGFRVGVEFHHQALAVDLEGRFDLPVELHSADAGPFTTQLLVATLASCWRGSWNPASWNVCLLGAAGSQVASASSLRDAHTVVEPYFALGPRVSLETPLAGPISLRLGLDLLVPLWRTRLVVDLPEPVQVWTTPPVAGVLGLDVLVDL